jgi:hypothetical protein
MFKQVGARLNPARTLIPILLAGLILPQIGTALMVKVTMPGLVTDAELIVHGTVTKIECRWGYREWDPGSRLIFTDVTIAPSGLLKGTTDETEIILETEGGRVGDIGLNVEDMPQFQVGEDVIVFASPANKSGRHYVPDLYQGKYTLTDGIVEELNVPVGQFARQIARLVEAEQGRER